MWRLDEAQQKRLQALLTTEPCQVVRPIMITTYERARIEERREIALLQLEARFGPLATEVRERVEMLSPQQLRQLILDLLKAQSLEELHLESRTDK